MERRTNKDIWRGLWELLLVETCGKLSAEEAESVASDQLKQKLGLEGVKFHHVSQCVHKLTHRTIHASFVRAELCDVPAELPENAGMFKGSEVKKLPVSRLIDRYLRGL